MKESLIEASQYIPFIGMAVNKTEHMPMITRLIEAAIIGGIVLYGNVRINEHETAYQKEQIKELRQNQKEIQNNITQLMILINKK